MKRLFLILLLLAATGGVFFFVRAKSKAGEAKDGPAPERAVAVIVGDVRQADVPVWLAGIGSVQASNTVTVRPRVGGSLDKINFTEGSLVSEGDIIAEIDPRPFEAVLAQAKAKKIQDEATLGNARLDEQRFANLLKTGAVSTQQADQSKAAVAQLEALVQADQAAIQAAELDLEFTKVRAPISGRTGVRSVDPGNLVTANQETGIVVITAIQPIHVIFTLPQQHLPALSATSKPDAPKLEVEALDENRQVLGEGRLELIDNQIDPATGTLKLKASFSNDNLTLWPGQFVSARVLVETRRDALVVAPEAVLPGLDGPFCYVMKEDHTVEARPVKTGLRVDEGTVIDAGLKTGEKVVVTGHTKLRPGAKVTPQEPTKAP
jgi:multidrug efflux system membrane fusion protein